MNNAMLAYMSIFHFEDARKCADFLLETYTKEPEIYFRKAQVSVILCLLMLDNIPG